MLLAVAMAISPLAVLASVLLLTTERGVRKAGAYAVGWVLAVGAVGALTLVADAHLDTASDGASTASAVLDVVLGAVLVVLALRRRAGGTSSRAEPGWMRRLDAMSPLVALGFGLFMPPYVIAAAAANDIVRDDGSGGSTVLAVVVFTIVASLGVLVPWILALTSRSADRWIATWRAWLLGNWQAVLFWLLLVVGLWLVAKGAYALAT